MVTPIQSSRAIASKLTQQISAFLALENKLALGLTLMLSDSNPDLLRPVQSDEFLPTISRWTTLGGLILVGMVGAAFTLAAVIKYNVTVKADATVRPSGELRIVQAPIEGTVTSIKVKENQVVKQGEAIATIDNSQLQTKKSKIEGNIQQNRLKLTQIAAQMDSLKSQHHSESSLMNRTIASAQADLGLNQRDYRDKQITTKTEVQEAEASLELAREELKRYQQLGNTGAIAQLQIKEKQQAFKAALAKLERAKATLNPSAASVAIATEKIAQERARGESTLATLSKELQNLQSTRIEIQNQLGSDLKELQQIGIDLSKTFILAPAAGTILKLELRNPSQVVRSGDPIAQIAPSNIPLVVKARVAAQDVSKVKTCHEKEILDCEQAKVQLRFSTYPYPDYGTLKGAVRAISPDAITPQSNNTTSASGGTGASGATSASAAVPYYEVTIQPEKPYLVRSDRQYPIQPGMEVTADIISREETALTFILRKAKLLTDF